MRAIINGHPNAPIVWAKGSNAAAKIVVTNDDGSALDITGGAINVVVYDRSDRANAAIATHTNETIVAPTAGYATLAVDDSELTYGPGTYYAFVRYVASGGLTNFSEPYILEIN